MILGGLMTFNAREIKGRHTFQKPVTKSIVVLRFENVNTLHVILAFL